MVKYDSNEYGSVLILFPHGDWRSTDFTSIFILKSVPNPPQVVEGDRIEGWIFRRLMIKQNCRCWNSEEKKTENAGKNPGGQTASVERVTINMSSLFSELAHGGIESNHIF